MLIAYLLGQYPTVSNTFVYREIRAFIDGGVPTTAYALSRTQEPNGDLFDQTQVRWVPSAHSVILMESIYPELEQEWLDSGGRQKDLRRARWLARKWKQAGVTCVHSHFLGFSSALASIACTLANIPLVVTVHARGILVPDEMSFLAIRRASSLIAISEETRRLILDRSGRDSFVLPVPIHDAAVAGTSANDFHVLSVGRAVPKKGYPVLRAAISSLEFPVQWTVAGANEEDLGGRMPGLTAMGSVPFTRIDATYKKGVDVFALACCEAADGDADGIPVAILEAMARGVAVVTTSVGGIPELITHEENGLLVPPEQPGAFTDALNRLKRDKVLRERLAKNGRDHVRKNRSESMHVERLIRHIGEIQAEMRFKT